MFPGGTGTGAGDTSGAPGWMGVPSAAFGNMLQPSGWIGTPSDIGLPLLQAFGFPFPVFPHWDIPAGTSGNVYYVDSAAGSNTAPYDTWAKAATTLATIAAIDIAGDTIYVASTHAESTAGAVTLTWAGTATAPTRIICADKTSGQPPTIIATGATVTTTGNNGITVNSSGAVVDVYGIAFIAGSGASGTANITSGNNTYAEQCSFQIASTSVSSTISTNTGTWRSCSVKFAAAAQIINISANHLWSGGSLLSGGTSPTALISVAALAAFAPVEDIDLTNASSTINLSSGASSGAVLRMRKIKTPASWSGSLNSSGQARNQISELVNVDNTGTNYTYHRMTQFGDVYQETTLVRTGGSSDGTTPLSWKMVSLAASGVFPIAALVSGELRTPFVPVVGQPVTLTVEVLHDNVSPLRDSDFWIEVRYATDSGDPLGAIASSAKASVLAQPTTLPVGVGSANWTTTGMTAPNSQKVSVTFTPQLKGPCYITFFLTKASYTVYVDLRPTITVAGNTIPTGQQSMSEDGSYVNDGFWGPGQGLQQIDEGIAA